MNRIITQAHAYFIRTLLYHYLEHTEGLFRNSHILVLHNLFRFHSGVYMCNALHVLDYDVTVESYVSDNRNTHSHLTRNSMAIRLPKYNLERTKANIIYSASKVWNELPDEVKNSNSVGIFKSRFGLQCQA